MEHNANARLEAKSKVRVNTPKLMVNVLVLAKQYGAPECP